MDFLLPILLVAFFPIAVIYLLVSHSKLKRKVALLERRLTTLDVAPHTAAPDQISPEPTPPEDAAASVGPWSAVTAAPPAASPSPPPARPPEPPQQPAGPNMIALFIDWLRVNWFYAISAVSLALAGVFLVQYGSEQGLLPPRVRVLAALALGAGLVAAGEWLRRRYGDHAGVATAYIPSVFAGAGVVALFAGVLSARMLYGLIGAEVAMIGLVATGLLAVGLGWLFGPLLAGVGIVGAMVAPFVVGGDSDAPYWLYAYFGLITKLCSM